MDILWEFFENFWESKSQLIIKSYLNMAGINFLVKILSQGRRRKEEGQEFRSLEVRETSSSHFKKK